MASKFKSLSVDKKKISGKDAECKNFLVRKGVIDNESLTVATIVARLIEQCPSHGPRPDVEAGKYFLAISDERGDNRRELVQARPGLLYFRDRDLPWTNHLADPV